MSFRNSFGPDDGQIQEDLKSACNNNNMSFEEGLQTNPTLENNKKNDENMNFSFDENMQNNVSIEENTNLLNRRGTQISFSEQIPAQNCNVSFQGGADAAVLQNNVNDVSFQGGENADNHRTSFDGNDNNISFERNSRGKRFSFTGKQSISQNEIVEANLYKTPEKQIFIDFSTNMTLGNDKFVKKAEGYSENEIKAENFNLYRYNLNNTSFDEDKHENNNLNGSFGEKSKNDPKGDRSKLLKDLVSRTSISTNNETVLYHSNGMKKNLVAKIIRNNLDKVASILEKGIEKHKRIFIASLGWKAKENENILLKKLVLKEKIENAFYKCGNQFEIKRNLQNKHFLDRFRETALLSKIETLSNLLTEKERKIEELSEALSRSNKFISSFLLNLKELEEKQNELLSFGKTYEHNNFCMENVNFTETSKKRDETVKMLIANLKELNESYMSNNLNTTNLSILPIDKSEKEGLRLLTCQSNYQCLTPRLDLDFCPSYKTKPTTQTPHNISSISFNSRRNISQNVFFTKSKIFL